MGPQLIGLVGGGGVATAQKRNLDPKPMDEGKCRGGVGRIEKKAEKTEGGMEKQRARIERSEYRQRTKPKHGQCRHIDAGGRERGGEA